MTLLRCPGCLFCEEVHDREVRCTNADLAQDSGWEDIYLTQGYLDVPFPEPGDPDCFWYVPVQPGN